MSISEVREFLATENLSSVRAIAAPILTEIEARPGLPR